MICGIRKPNFKMPKLYLKLYKVSTKSIIYLKFSGVKKVIIFIIKKKQYCFTYNNVQSSKNTIL